jgi:hypothetical protein
LQPLTSDCAAEPIIGRYRAARLIPSDPDGSDGLRKVLWGGSGCCDELLR